MTGHWAFRVASTPEVGGGHIARCRAVAEAMSEHAAVIFVLDPEGSAWKSKLEQVGITAICEGEDEPKDWIGCLMDGYHFSEDDAANWKRKTGWLAFVDDFGTPLRAADLVVAPSFSPEAVADIGIPYLAGPQYAMIAAAFARLLPPLIKDDIGHLLVSFGLRDSRNATSLVLDAIDRMEAVDRLRDITVALGSQAPHRPAVMKKIDDLLIEVKVTSEKDDFLSLLMKTDMVIGAGGVSLFERMASGRPSITLTTAKNQETSAWAASRAGATFYLADCHDIEATLLTGHIDEFISNVDLRQQMSVKAGDFVDGKGAIRISDALLKLSSFH
jgi:UDP-2,4-diacetamido-2,4,6-trideoxy-beta-L-altropyranose hydrolase